MKLNIYGYDVFVAPADAARGTKVLDHLRPNLNSWVYTSTLQAAVKIGHGALGGAVRAARVFAALSDDLALVSGTDGWYMLTDDPRQIRLFRMTMLRHIRTRSLTTLAEVVVAEHLTTSKADKKDLKIIEIELDSVIKKADLILSM